MKDVENRITKKKNTYKKGKKHIPDHDLIFLIVTRTNFLFLKFQKAQEKLSKEKPHKVTQMP